MQYKHKQSKLEFGLEHLIWLLRENRYQFGSFWEYSPQLERLAMHLRLMRLERLMKCNANAQS